MMDHGASARPNVRPGEEVISGLHVTLAYHAPGPSAECVDLAASESQREMIIEFVCCVTS